MQGRGILQSPGQPAGCPKDGTEDGAAGQAGILVVESFVV